MSEFVDFYTKSPMSKHVYCDERKLITSRMNMKLRSHKMSSCRQHAGSSTFYITFGAVRQPASGGVTLTELSCVWSISTCSRVNMGGIYVGSSSRPPSSDTPHLTVLSVLNTCPSDLRQRQKLTNMTNSNREALFVFTVEATRWQVAAVDTSGG